MRDDIDDIFETYMTCKGDLKKTSRKLGMPYTSLWYLQKQHKFAQRRSRKLREMIRETDETPLLPRGISNAS